MNNKKEISLPLGIAAVAFTIQFGGGFASGNQIMQYFVDYGVWSIILPILAQGLLSIFSCYGLKYAFINKTFDYRSFSDKFYGKYSFIFSNLSEVMYCVLIFAAVSVAIATTGRALSYITNINYLVCTIITALIIIVISVYGPDTVRLCASTVSIPIIIGLIIVLVPNIVAQRHIIINNIICMSKGKMPISSVQTGYLGPALFNAIIYSFFQLTHIGFMYQQVKPCTNTIQIRKATIYMFILNTASMLMVVLVMCAIIYSNELIDTNTSKLIEIPMILLVEKGVGTSYLRPIIYILIFLGALSTGFNMISGAVDRGVNQICKNDKDNPKKRKFWSLILATILTTIPLITSQGGIGNMVRVGYKWIGVASCIVIGIPYVIHTLYSLNKKKIK